MKQRVWPEVQEKWSCEGQVERKLLVNWDWCSPSVGSVQINRIFDWVLLFSGRFHIIVHCPWVPFILGLFFIYVYHSRVCFRWGQIFWTGEALDSVILLYLLVTLMSTGDVVMLPIHPSISQKLQKKVTPSGYIYTTCLNAQFNF